MQADDLRRTEARGWQVAEVVEGKISGRKLRPARERLIAGAKAGARSGAKYCAARQINLLVAAPPMSVAERPILKDANQKGPHWADPLKAWADVLVNQGKIKDAFVKYDEALKYAPNWAALKEAREAVANQKTN